jgi:hypothetical protein
MNYLSPKLDIAMYDVLQPSNPFSAPIILKNTGSVSINNIMLSYKINNFEAGLSGLAIKIEGSTMNRTQILIERLKPGESKTLDFSFANQEAPIVCNTKPFIEIVIKYKKYFRSYSKTSRFKTEKYESGKFVWLPN